LIGNSAYAVLKHQTAFSPAMVTRNP